MKTIVILNNKGGVGKTALSCIVAELLMIDGKRVAVVDLDSQLNAVDLLRRADGGNVFPLIDVLPSPDMPPDFAALTVGGYDVVIVDTPPRIEGEGVLSAVAAGDVFLVPFDLSRHALFGLERTFEILPDGRPVIPVLNANGPKTRFKKDLLSSVRVRLGQAVGDLRPVVDIPIYAKVESNLSQRRDFSYSLTEKQFAAFGPLLDAVKKEID